MLCIVFYLNLRLKYVVKYLFFIFLNTRGYPSISVDIKKLCEYLTNMGTGTGQIFIQWVGYE